MDTIRVQIVEDIIYIEVPVRREEMEIKATVKQAAGGEWRVLFVTIACIIGSNVVVALCATAEPKKRKDLFLE